MWKKTFKTIHQLLCFVGHPVSESEEAYQGNPTPELLIETFEFRDYIYDVSSSKSSNPRTPSPEI